MDRESKTPGDYLKMPYARVLTPDDETGTYTAEILEFPGCIALGDTPEEAYERLESAAAGWIEAALNMGQDIPEPTDPASHSGRIVLRLPRSLHRRAAQMAERDGTSLNQFLVAAVAERVGAENLYAQTVRRLEALVSAPSIVHVYMQRPFATPSSLGDLYLYRAEEPPTTTTYSFAVAGPPNEE